jgi:hypothetical protein
MPRPQKALLDSGSTNRLRRWMANQPQGEELVPQLSDFDLKAFMSAPATLAYWLFQYREELAEAPEPVIVCLLGANEMYCKGGGAFYRYVPALLGFDKMFHFVAVGPGIAREGRYSHVARGYPVETTLKKACWCECAGDFMVQQGMRFAFLFSPEFYSHLLDDEQASTLKQLKGLNPLRDAGVHMGMTSYSLTEGARDGVELLRNRLVLVRPRKNPWCLTVNCPPSPKPFSFDWSAWLWDIEPANNG